LQSRGSFPAGDCSLLVYPARVNLQSRGSFPAGDCSLQVYPVRVHLHARGSFPAGDCSLLVCPTWHCSNWWATDSFVRLFLTYHQVSPNSSMITGFRISLTFTSRCNWEIKRIKGRNIGNTMIRQEDGTTENHYHLHSIYY
jgi:hypothetical protein